jgi:hypothetical protein
MQSSWFEVEVHAKSIQDNMLRECEHYRRIDEALRGKQSSGAGMAIARWLAAAGSWLSSRRPVLEAHADSRVRQLSTLASVVAEPDRPAPRTHLVRAAEPYAGMVVIARGKTTKLLAEPSGVQD